MVRGLVPSDGWNVQRALPEPNGTHYLTLFGVRDFEPKPVRFAYRILTLSSWYLQLKQLSADRNRIACHDSITSLTLAAEWFQQVQVPAT